MPRRHRLFGKMLGVLLVAGSAATAAQAQSGPVRHWPGDGNFDDVATFVPAAQAGGVTFASGLIGQAFSLDGADDYVDFGAANGNFDGSDFSISVWINGQDLYARGLSAVLSKRGDDANFFNMYVRQSGKVSVEMRVSPGDYLSIEGTRDVGTGWHHLTLVRQGNTVTLYGDGQADGSGSFTSDMSESAYTTQALTLGRSLPYGHPFKGQFDDVRIYDRALAPAEIASQAELGPVRHWPGDGDLADVVTGVAATEAGGVTFAPGLIGQAFSLDGADDSVDFGAANGNFGSSDFSISVWINGQDIYARGLSAVLSKRGDNANFFNIYVRNTGKVSVELRAVPGDYLNIEGTRDLGTGWHNLALVRLGNTVTLYGDGQADGSGSFSSDMSEPAYTTQPLTLGTSVLYGNPFKGQFDDVRIYDRALTPAEIASLANTPPTADPGGNQSIHAGEAVQLDGLASFDAETPSQDLLYAWSIASTTPAGLTGTFAPSASSPTPMFTPDDSGSYEIGLTVTDQGGLSGAASMTLSALNSAPNADAGSAQGTYVGSTVALDGSASNDPDFDPITFAWSFDGKPAGSQALLSSLTSSTPSFTPDLVGEYDLQLFVNDGFVDSAPAAVTIQVVDPQEFAAMNAMQALNVITALPPERATTKGNQKALSNSVSQAIEALNKGKTAKAIDKLESALERTDGCTLRGTPDQPGGGGGTPPQQDYLTDCGDQRLIYNLIRDALSALGVQ